MFKKPPLKFGTISSLLRRKDKQKQILNMESARLVIALLGRTVNILVSTKFTEEKKKEKNSAINQRH